MKLQTQAWRLIGITGSEPGVLTLADGRLAFIGEAGSAFDVPLTSVTGVKFPWYYFNGGCKLRIGPDEFRFSFVQPHNDNADIGEGRRAGTEWKAALSR